MYSRLKEVIFNKLSEIQSVISVKDFQDKASSLINIAFEGKNGPKWDKTRSSICMKLETATMSDLSEIEDWIGRHREEANRKKLSQIPKRG